MLKTKGQSTAEYAIVIGLVIAVAAGILQVALKHGIASKNSQAVDWMLTSGDNALGTTVDDSSVALYTQDLRKTTVDADSYEDTSVMSKGGKEEKKQSQTTDTTAVSIETIDAADTGD